MPSKKGNKSSRDLLKYLRYSHLGLQLLVSFCIFTGLGYWLDRKLGTLPLFMLVGLAVGFAGGTYAVYRDLFPPTRSSKRFAKRPQRDGPAHEAGTNETKKDAAENSGETNG